MPTLRITISILFFSIAFISCNNKKSNRAIAETKIAAPAATDTVNATTTETIGLPAYSDAWEQTVTQTFMASSRKISLIKGAKGLKVTVDPSLLEKEDGSAVDGNITVKIIELTNSEELFKSNAATISNGSLLVSGGSYFVGMECNGQRLRIKNQKHLQMEFPRISNNEMELFYGNRDSAGSMNWTKAETPLSFDQVMKYGSYNPPYPVLYQKKPFKSKFMMYKSLNNKIYFEDRFTTVKRMVDILQKRGVDKKIDTVRIPVTSTYIDLKGQQQFYYDTTLKYRVMSCCQIEAEKDSLARGTAIIKQQAEANFQYNEEWKKVNSNNMLTSQLQKYYAPSEVTQLGWINCDRFYNSPQNIEIPVEIPYTFNNPEIEYFLIYKSFNGLMSGRIRKNARQQYALTKLPQGQSVTLVGFTKSDGKIYHCKEAFVIQPGKVLKPTFNIITQAEMSRMFGTNVKS